MAKSASREGKNSNKNLKMLCKNASNVNSARGAKVARSAAVTPVRVCGERPPTVIIVMIIMMMTVHFVRCEWPRRIKLKRSAPMWLQLAYLLTLHFYCTLYTLVPRAFCCVFNYHFLPPFFAVYLRLPSTFYQ